MAGEKHSSSKKIGGNLVPPGRYVINRALISEDLIKEQGKEDRAYDTLEVELVHLDANNQITTKCLTNLRLNGCWRARKGSDGNPYKAHGSFYDRFLGATTGKDFTTGRDYINNNLRGFALDIKHHQYPSSSGDFGTVYEIALSTQVFVNPTVLGPLPAIPAPTVQTQVQQGQGQTQTPDPNLGGNPF